MKFCDILWDRIDTWSRAVIPDRCLNILGKLQPMFNFTASKYVLIKDWRLGVILRALQVAILIYVAQDIFTKASYLLTEVPTGVIVPYAPTGTRSERRSLLQEQSKSFSLLPYCSSPDDYNFQWSNNTFDEFKCIYTDSSTLTTKGETEFFVTTYFTTDRLFTVRVDDGQKCPKAGEPGAGGDVAVPAKSVLITQIENACMYEKKSSFFPIAPEDTTVNVIHGFFASTVDRSASLPRTIIRNRDKEEVLEVPQSEVLSLKVADWLNLTGVDLDKDLGELGADDETLAGDAGTEYAGKYPKARLSGVNILVTMSYYQRKLIPFDHSLKKVTGKGSDEMVCFVDVVPQYRWSIQGSEIRYMMNTAEDPVFLQTDGLPDEVPVDTVANSQVDFLKNGILFKFTVAGNVGRFNFGALLDAIVAGSVLLSIAQVIVTFVALYGLGLSSALYMEFMRESVDWRKEYARFAAQALVAGHAFMSYDTNDSRKLDRKEIFKTLQTVLGDRLPDDKVAALTDFLMRQGELDVKVAKGAFRLDEGDLPASNLISIEEWIDIFTEEKVHLSSLERLIDSEYKDVRTREFLVRLAQGVRMRGLGAPDEEDGPVDEEEEPLDEDLQAYRAAKREFTQDFLANSQEGRSDKKDDPDV